MDILSTIKPFKKIVLVWSRHHKTISAFLSFLSIFLLFAMSYLWSSFFVSNERDTLMVAKQFVQKDWIPHDWYLNQDFGYRNFFNLIFGVFTYLPIDMAYISIGFRIVLYLAFSFAFCRLMFLLKIPILLFLPLFYYYLRNAGIFAGEAIIGGIEAKPFAYVFAIFALDALLRKKYRIMMLYLGFSFSFHILVGFYATLCSGLTVLFSPSDNKSTSFSLTALKKNIFLLLRACPFYFMSSIFGIYTLIHYLIENQLLTSIEKQKAALIYITFRVPHHTYLFFFRIESLLQIIPYALIFILGLIFFHRLKDAFVKQICLYIIWALGCVAFGMTITLLISDVSLLKFYWYRYFDSMGALLSTFVVGYALYKLYLYLQKKCTTISLPSSLKKINFALVLKIASVTIALIISTTIFITVYKNFHRIAISKISLFQARRIMTAAPGYIDAFTWIKINTKKDVLFLTSPNTKSFYYYAERPRLVSIKHSPQSDVHILEWFERIKDLTVGDLNNKIIIHTKLTHPIRTENMISKKSATERNLVKSLNDLRLKLGLKPLVCYYPTASSISATGEKNFNKLSSPYLKKLKAKYGKDYSAVYYFIDGKREKNFPFQLVYQNEKVSIYKL